MLAFKRGYALRIEADRDAETDLWTCTSRVPDELRTASAQLG